MIASSLVSRRWRIGSKESPGCNAGADCAVCDVAAEPENGRWRCPRCGAVADGCGDTYGLKACELLAGHEDAHESRSGTSWPQRADAEHPTSKRFTCGNHGCPLDFGHEGDCALAEVTPEAPGDLPEVACKVFFDGEEVATATGVEFHIVPPALEATALRIAGVDLADKPDGIALAPPALDALWRRHVDIFLRDDDLSPEGSMAAVATEAYVLGGAEGHDSGRKRERELMLRLVDDFLFLNSKRKRVRKVLKSLRRRIEAEGK